MTATAVAERIEGSSSLVATPMSESAAIFSLIERMATDPTIDLDRVERVIAMREGMEASAAKRAFFSAFTAAQAEMPQVVRDAANDQTKSKYARYETISDAIQPIITKHGFSITFGEAKAEKPDHLCITGTLMHEAGHSKDYSAEVPIDMYGMKGNPNKTATHAWGSTKSYGRRYLKLDIFDIAVKNQDDDGNAAGGAVADAETIAEDQTKELLALIERSKATPEKFCAVANIAAVPDVLAIHFDAAKQMLLDRIAKLETLEKTKAKVDPKGQFDSMERDHG